MRVGDIKLQAHLAYTSFSTDRATGHRRGRGIAHIAVLPCVAWLRPGAGELFQGPGGVRARGM